MAVNPALAVVRGGGRGRRQSLPPHVVPDPLEPRRHAAVDARRGGLGAAEPPAHHAHLREVGGTARAGLLRHQRT